MHDRNVFVFAIVCLAAAAARSPPSPGCPPCPGPVKFYKEIGCQPVFKNPGDCCPMKWNCDHMKSRSKDKCYAYGTEYNVNDNLKDEDKGCRQSCKCLKMDEEMPATWACVQIGRISAPLAAGCYRPRNATMCFPGPEVCPGESEEIAKCEVDGTTYEDGMSFESAAHPHKTCWCGPGWRGEFEMPFCKDWIEHKCGFELDAGEMIRERCAPVWHMGQHPISACNREWRCGKDDDKITRKADKGEAPADMKCMLGKTVMQQDDDINLMDGDDCIKCRCDIPPVPTCMRLPKAACSGNLDDDSSEEKK